MTAYALTPIQPVSVLEQIRDGRPGFLPLVLEPTVEREVQSLPSLRWVPDDGIPDGRARRTSTVSPVLPDQPCPECGGDGFVNDETDTSYGCPKCTSGRVPLPLLIPGEAWEATSEGVTTWHVQRPRRFWLPMEVSLTHHDAAGLAVLDRPDWLPVTRLNRGEPDPMGGPYVTTYNDGVTGLMTPPDRLADFSLTDAFPTPPPVGGWVVDLGGARWLGAEDVITEQVLASVDMSDFAPARRPVVAEYLIPLSPGSGLTVVEVP